MNSREEVIDALCKLALTKAFDLESQALALGAVAEIHKVLTSAEALEQFYNEGKARVYIDAILPGRYVTSFQVGSIEEAKWQEWYTLYEVIRAQFLDWEQIDLGRDAVGGTYLEFWLHPESVGDEEE